MSHNNNTTKKILLVTRPLQLPWDEASKVFAFNLATHIENTDITILTHGTIKDLKIANGSTITQKSIYTGSENDFTLYQKIRLLAWIACNAKKYDIIHLIFTPTKLNSRILSFLCGSGARRPHIIQTIATVREDLHGRIKENLHTYKNIFFADTLVTYSQFARKNLQKAGFKNVHHIYPGIDLKKFHPTKKDEQLSKKWHLKERDFIVQYNGEFSRLGATDLIITAFLEVWKDPQNAHIKYLCGCRIKNTKDQLKKDQILSRIEKAGHSDKIIFSDTFHGNMNTLYNMADLIIFPVVDMKGKFDVPLAMIEPYACKKIVVASDLPVFKEFSSSDINVIIPKNSAQALMEAICTAAQNPARNNQKEENAYTFIHKNFDITKIALHYQKLYENITERSHKST